MPRYTDIDLLIDKVEETTWYHINKDGELVVGANSETDIPLYKHSDIKRVLAEAPIADVVPEREGEWVWKVKIEPNAQNRKYCSVCDEECPGKNNYYLHPNFCPNCGAKMKDGAE